MNDKAINFGACIPTISMGGITRGLITLVNVKGSLIKLSGVAVAHPAAFDPKTAKLILKHCPIYSHQDHPAFQGLVTIVDNPYQEVIDRSDLVKLSNFIKSNPHLDKTDWSKTTIVVIAHGQCDWTRNNLAISLGFGSNVILGAVSVGSMECFPEIYRPRVKLLYNGIDSNRCIPSVGRPNMRKKLGISDKLITVLYMGRFNPDKNPLAVAQAIRNLPKDFHALYVGEGIREQDVKRDVTDICGDRVTFVPRVENVGNILGSVDCIVSASPSEGGCHVFAEAWAAGCSLVSTKTGFLPEMEKEFGKVFYEIPFSPTGKEVAEVIKTAVANDQSVLDRGNAAYQKYFTAEKMNASYEAFFLEAIENGCLSK